MKRTHWLSLQACTVRYCSVGRTTSSLTQMATISSGNLLFYRYLFHSFFFVSMHFCPFPTDERLTLGIFTVFLFLLPLMIFVVCWTQTGFDYCSSSPTTWLQLVQHYSFIYVHFTYSRKSERDAPRANDALYFGGENVQLQKSTEKCSRWSIARFIDALRCFDGEHKLHLSPDHNDLK